MVKCVVKLKNCVIVDSGDKKTKNTKKIQNKKQTKTGGSKAPKVLVPIMILKKSSFTFTGYICSTDKTLINSQCNPSTPAGSDSKNCHIAPCKVKTQCYNKNQTSQHFWPHQDLWKDTPHHYVVITFIFNFTRGI